MELTSYSSLSIDELCRKAKEAIEFVPVDMVRVKHAMSTSSTVLCNADGPLQEYLRYLVIGQLLMLESIREDFDSPKAIEPRIEDMELVFANRSFCGKSLQDVICKLVACQAQLKNERNGIARLFRNGEAVERFATNHSNEESH